MEFGPMAVRVKILVSSQPTAQNMVRLKTAAAELTDDRKSITVTLKECELSQQSTSESRYELITDFTMRRTAQYKVVDDIAHGFKQYTWDLEDYEDMIISFPISAPEQARQQRKQQRRKKTQTAGES
jgi:hypothetical protein